MLNTVQIGDIGEAIAIAEFTKKMCPVSKPLSNNTRYDLLVEIKGKIYKVQVKTTASVKDGRMEFFTKSTNYVKGTWENNSYSSQEVDLFFLYCVENNWSGLYQIKTENAPTNINIRVTPPKNNQKIGINLAEDFVFDKQFEMLQV